MKKENEEVKPWVNQKVRVTGRIHGEEQTIEGFVEDVFVGKGFYLFPSNPTSYHNGARYFVLFNEGLIIEKF